MRSNMINGLRLAGLIRSALTHLLALTVFGVAGLAQAATLPTPPLLFETPYVAPTGRIVNVPAGGDFQAALNNAQLGDTIVLEAGATYAGPFTLPKKAPGTGWIYIQSSAYNMLPGPGVRVSLADGANMPKLVVAALYGAPIVQASPGAHHYRFIGIHFRPLAGNFVYSLVNLGNADVSPDTLANNFTFDRCIFQGDTAVGSRRGIAMDARYVALVDSHLSDFKEAGADTQAAWAYNTSGPIKIVNNYLEASGENVLFGGADSNAASLIPADIEISRNYFFKPLSWIGSAWTVKNLLEFKASSRVVVRGNRFENNWAAAQSGFTLLVTPRNQNGRSPWSFTRDIMIEGNVFINIGSGINILGTDNDYPSEHTQRIAIRHNVIQVTGLNGADGRMFQFLVGPDDVVVDHNTAFTLQSYGMTDSQTDNLSGFAFTNNIVSYGRYGFIGSGTGDGNATLNAFYDADRIFTRNAVIGGSSAAYPAGNYFPSTAAAVGFVDYPNGNYRLSPDSTYKSAGTDGKDLGADFDLINSLMQGQINPASRVPTPPIDISVH